MTAKTAKPVLKPLPWWAGPLKFFYFLWGAAFLACGQTFYETTFQDGNPLEALFALAILAVSTLPVAFIEGQIWLDRQ